MCPALGLGLGLLSVVRSPALRGPPKLSASLEQGDTYRPPVPPWAGRCPRIARSARRARALAGCARERSWMGRPYSSAGADPFRLSRSNASAIRAYPLSLG
ncbi:hypothetical protein GCM10027074_11340 [Streptomyces deserti]